MTLKELQLEIGRKLYELLPPSERVFADPRIDLVDGNRKPLGLDRMHYKPEGKRIEVVLVPEGRGMWEPHDCETVCQAHCQTVAEAPVVAEAPEKGGKK